MGRKGIGKLSLLSIAKTVEVHSVRDGERNALVLNIDDITDAITRKLPYHPKDIACDDSLEIGTIVKLKDFKKRLRSTSEHLKKRIARRFGVVGARHNFQVFIDDAEISPTDRGYHDKVQFLWAYSLEDDEKALFTNANKVFARDGTVNGEKGYAIKGWIGTVEKSGQLKDDTEGLNRIVILTRGKVAQEDILGDLGETGLFSKYLVGEIEADFLDIDNEEDIATSSRQSFIQDDERFLLLRSFLVREIKYIQSNWTELRNDVDSKKALEIEAVKEWFDTLESVDLKRKAKSLFGKIGRLTSEDDAARIQLTGNSILAFENLKIKGRLDALDRIGMADIGTLSMIVDAYDDVEATLYHQIVTGRLKVIDELAAKIDVDALEAVLQRHLFDHLWLLDPSWERATGGPRIEESIKGAFSGIDAKLTEEEKAGRVDIRYRKTSGTHVIVELKRASVVTSIYDLAGQVRKYIDALRKCLEASGESHPSIQAVIVTGVWPKGWEDTEKKNTDISILGAQETRLILYEQLLNQAQTQYKDYLDSQKRIGKIRSIIERIAREVAVF